MNRLWVRLTLAFALVTLVSVAVAALFANQQTSSQFRGFLARAQAQDVGLTDALIGYYATNGTWQGVETVFADQPGRGLGRGQMRGAPTLLLADADGTLVYTSNPDISAATVLADTTAIPLVLESHMIGTLYVRTGSTGGMTAAAEHFLAQLNFALVQAAAIGALLGALLGLVLARSLTAPLNRMASAARQLAAGDHSQRVPVHGPAEIVAASQAFNDMASALEQAEQLRKRMIADIAHELRTPLAVVQGNLQAILDDIYPLEKAEIKTIFAETMLLGRLVDDLRELALAEAGQLRLELQSVDLPNLIDQSLAMLSGAAAEKHIQIMPEVAEQIPPVWADPTRTSQILHNLLGNAIRYTPPGGTITVRARMRLPTTPTTSGKILAEAVVVQVEDTGPGIAATDLPHVFERFWRADRARSRTHGGTGLGLAIAQQLTLAQGGQIGVESSTGQGSCFWFSLPTMAE